MQIIYRNILSAMHTLVTQSEKFGGECDTKSDVKSSMEYFKAMKQPHLSEGKVDSEAADHIKKLWADAGIRATFDARAKFQVPDSAVYFFENIDRIAKDDYSPTYEDILRCRSRTTGIVETEFQIKNDLFKIMDVGGQRSERKKWIRCFEDVTAVIFVAEIGRAVQQECRDRSRMPSSA
eukprot:TRINITY_DN11047_c0_g1_i10.p1 TRINITY_DN11047_c0_g1~~TRINITY_DN11047_c0_g1_i10.p1  ORF type:complete len:179 (+),score=21.79 TRINITY_DN11047_c0_g1_i10:317-853(+)